MLGHRVCPGLLTCLGSDARATSSAPVCNAGSNWPILLSDVSSRDQGVLPIRLEASQMRQILPNSSRKQDALEFALCRSGIR